MGKTDDGGEVDWSVRGEKHTEHKKLEMKQKYEPKKEQEKPRSSDKEEKQFQTNIAELADGKHSSNSGIQQPDFDLQSLTKEI